MKINCSSDALWRTETGQCVTKEIELTESPEVSESATSHTPPFISCETTAEVLQASSEVSIAAFSKNVSSTLVSNTTHDVTTTTTTTTTLLTTTTTSSSSSTTSIHQSHLCSIQNSQATPISLGALNSAAIELANSTTFEKPSLLVLPEFNDLAISLLTETTLIHSEATTNQNDVNASILPPASANDHFAQTNENSSTQDGHPSTSSVKTDRGHLDRTKRGSEADSPRENPPISSFDKIRNSSKSLSDLRRESSAKASHTFIYRWFHPNQHGHRSPTSTANTSPSMSKNNSNENIHESAENSSNSGFTVDNFLYFPTLLCSYVHVSFLFQAPRPIIALTRSSTAFFIPTIGRLMVLTGDWWF